ncbi:Cob(I)alamin adenosyltransferase PduO [Mycobacterium marinum str. Europe]|nr:Cob(I)alamin adenosyltransferase PduO [Mycobacterium marinum str. Europe]
MRATSPSSSTVAPSPRNTSAISGTSRMSGQLVIVLVPSASSVAAMSLSTLFLAPPTATSPDNRFPPVTTNRSATRVSLVKRYQLVSQPGKSSGYRLIMAIHLTRIYTRTGDDGTTGLSDFSRVSKNDPRLVAYADCDEANSAIGVAVAMGSPDPQLADVLRQLQNDLFDAGADLSTPLKRSQDQPEHAALRITEAYIQRLEGWCDKYNETLPALNSFVLPGGSPLSALLHVARTVARRAERSAWAAVEADPEGVSALPAKYLNRLSDLLFILARAANPDGDVLWRPGGNRPGAG